MGIHLLKTHDSLPGGHQAFVAQGIVDTAPGIPLDIKVPDLPNSYIQRSNGIMVAKCSSVLPMWFGPTAKEDELDNINAVQIYKAQKSKHEIMNEQYDTMHQDASHKEQRWKGTVQLNEELTDFKQSFMKMVEQFDSM